MEQLIGNDRVEHAHAAFVEDTHDGLALLEIAPKTPSEFFVGRGQFHQSQILNMALVVADVPSVKPFTKAGLEESIVKLLAPKGAVVDTSLGHGAVEVQHADQARPSSAPVGDSQDRA